MDTKVIKKAIQITKNQFFFIITHPYDDREPNQI